MVNKTPAELDPGTPSDTSIVHSSENGVSTNSKGHDERDISRLQGTAPLYSSSKTYNVNDLVTESGTVFRNITAITIPETFTPAKWISIGGGSDLELIKDETLGADTDAWNITSIPARDFILILIHLKSVGGTLNIQLRFNNSTLAEYSYRRNEDFGTTVSTVTNDTVVELDPISIVNEEFHRIWGSNFLNDEKLLNHDNVSDDGGGAGTVPDTQETSIKFVQTAQITEINLDNVGSGDIATGSRVLVYASKT